MGVWAVLRCGLANTRSVDEKGDIEDDEDGNDDHDNDNDNDNNNIDSNKYKNYNLVLRRLRSHPSSPRTIYNSSRPNRC